MFFAVFIEFIAIGAVAAWSLHTYGSIKRSPIVAWLTTYWGWLACFMIVVLLPLDISATHFNRCVCVQVELGFASRDDFPGITCQNYLANQTVCTTRNETGLDGVVTPITTCVTTNVTQLSEAARRVGINMVQETCGSEPIIYTTEAVLHTLWEIIFWVTFWMAWIVAPFLQSYVESGSFTVLKKLKVAIIENIVIYAVLGVFGAIVLGYIIYTKSYGDDLFNFIAGAANAWGLFLSISMLGYGLVEVPRTIWFSGNHELTLRKCEWQAEKLQAQCHEAEAEVATTYAIVQRCDQRIKATNHTDKVYRHYLDTIISKCPADYGNRLSMCDREQVMIGADKVLNDVREKTLASLHYRVKSTQHQYEMVHKQFDTLCRKAFRLQDILNSEDDPHHQITSKLRVPRGTADTVDWWWSIKIYPVAARVFAGLCILLSLCILWSEMVLFLNDSGTHTNKADPTVNLSAFSWIVRVDGLDGFNLQIFILVPLSYMCFCAYWTLFRIRIFNYYNLQPNHLSSTNSILFSAAWISRLAAPMSYNYLLLLHETDDHATAFSKVMGDMNTLPFVGDKFNTYFPIFLAVLCVMTTFNLYARCMNCLNVKRFVYEDDFNDETILEGRKILSNERPRYEREFAAGGNVKAKTIHTKPDDGHPDPAAHIENGRRSRAMTEPNAFEPISRDTISRGNSYNHLHSLEADAAAEDDPDRSALFGGGDPHSRPRSATAGGPPGGMTGQPSRLAMMMANPSLTGMPGHGLSGGPGLAGGGVGGGLPPSYSQSSLSSSIGTVPRLGSGMGASPATGAGVGGDLASPPRPSLADMPIRRLGDAPIGRLATAPAPAAVPAAGHNAPPPPAAAPASPTPPTTTAAAPVARNNPVRSGFASFTSSISGFMGKKPAAGEHHDGAPLV